MKALVEKFVRGSQQISQAGGAANVRGREVGAFRCKPARIQLTGDEAFTMFTSIHAYIQIQNSKTLFQPPWLCFDRCKQRSIDLLTDSKFSNESVLFLQHRPGERQAGSLTIRHVPSRQGQGRGQGPATSSLPEREVCNCISCGKIYFTRSDTADTIAFLGAFQCSLDLSFRALAFRLSAVFPVHCIRNSVVHLPVLSRNFSAQDIVQIRSGVSIAAA